jgi:hypothetical protein
MVRILLSTIVAVWALLGGAATAGHWSQAVASEPNGYILRMGGKGKVVVVRGKKEMDVTGQRRFLLFSGDKPRVQGDAWVEVYWSHTRAIHRDPPLKTGPGAPGSPSPRRRAARGLVAARRQGSPPEPANRLFAKNVRSPYQVGANGVFRVSAVTVSKDVRPVRATFFRGQEASRQAIELDPKIESQGQFHRLTCTLDDPAGDGLGRFEVKVSFSDGSSDSALFEALSGPTGSSVSAFDQLRRASSAYAGLSPERDEWFLALNDLAREYEDLGCDSQAANLVLDWWWCEADNPAAQEALLGLAIPFEMGAVDALFGPPVSGPQPIDRSRSESIRALFDARTPTHLR